MDTGAFYAHADEDDDDHEIDADREEFHPDETTAAEGSDDGVEYLVGLATAAFPKRSSRS